jgi:hypothetical protein
MSKRTRTPVHVDLTVVVNFGDDYGSVKIVNDMRMPFTDMVLRLRDSGAELVITGVSKAAYATPAMWLALFGAKR